MFDIGWPEMLVVAVVLIVIVGPKDLPGMLRNFGRTTTKLRAMAGDFRKQFDEALKEAELDDVKGLVDDVRKLNPAADIRKAFSPMQKAADDVRSGLDAAMRPTAKPQAEKDAAKGSVSASAEATPAPPLKNGQNKSSANATDGAAKKSATAKARPASSARTKPASTKAATGRAAAKPAAAKSDAPKAPAKPKAAPKQTAAKSSKAGAGANKGRQAS
ncbi:MAG: Sec-independent protein translocase protein TatB [Rhizobiaceae bacterium]